MTGTRGLAVALLCTVFGAAGCVSVRYQGYEEARQPTGPQPYSLLVRQKVFLFMMNGDDVLELSGMLSLRDKLCQAGYPKVYYAQTLDVNWYTRELRRVTRDEPGARLVLLAYGAATERVLALARDAARDGLPVDGVILLDPVGAAGNLAETLPFDSVVVRSRGWSRAQALEARDHVSVPDAGHYGLPNSLPTVQTTLGVLTAAAANVRLDPPGQLPYLPLTDKPAPLPRPIDPATLVGPADEWDFLKPTPNPLPVPVVAPSVPLPLPRPAVALPRPRPVDGK